MQALQERRRLILIGVIVLALLCLVGALAFNIFYRRGGGQPQVAKEKQPTAAPIPTEEATTTTVAQEPSPTPTLVIEEEPTQEPTPTESIPPTATPTQPPPTPTTAPIAPVVEMVEVTEIGQILKNGSFEQGFAENGVGLDWREFRTDAAAVNFSPESAKTFVESGDHAQRISIDKSYQPDQYGGIYQTVEVEAGKPYTLTLYGQIRSGFGSVESSSYGYRLQYALDESGGEDWRAISATNWIELPWPEQSLDIANPTFSEYSTMFTPEKDKVTLFIRAWNKWPNGALGEYTLDNLSIVGPVPGRTQLIAKTTGGQPAPAQTPGGEMIDKPLPITGNGDDINLLTDPRFWGAALVLLLLTGGAFYRARWRW